MRISLPHLDLEKVEQMSLEAKIAGVILTLFVVAGIFFAVIGELALAATAEPDMSVSSASGQIAHADSGYYPNAEPSAWYILPGQMLGFGGTGFTPFEKISITNENSGSAVSEFADASGNLDASNLFAVPYNWQNSVQNFSIIGSESNWEIPVKITVGTYYPQITPSKWWLHRGQALTVSGSHFAPSEQVKLFENGELVARGTSTNAGTVHFIAFTPTSGSKASLKAVGQSTGLSSSRTIFLY